MSRIGLSLTALSMLIAACSSPDIAEGPDRTREPRTTTTSTATDETPLGLLLGFDVATVATDLEDPVAITPAPGIGDTFIVERVGRVVTASSGGTEVVLDITDLVGWDINEQGLLGFAVHPDFPTDPRGFAVYTDAGRDVVVSAFEWDVSSFSPTTRADVFDVPQPHQYHQGGGIAFGPYGYLWLSFGDGGGVGDQFDNGQNPHTRNGTIIRIDVDNGDPYAIPPTNPFADGNDGDRTVWAYGLRNPWRFTIEGDHIIIADVGQEGVEEINLASLSEGGMNFGWSILEGLDCFDADECDATGLTTPAVIITRDRTCAIIGGPVYHGAAIPEWEGHYLFGDFCTGRLRSIPFTNGVFGDVQEWTAMVDPLGMITTFGLDEHGNILVANLEGRVVRLDPIRSESAAP
jgi:glucose/arabinose dehydrogenase